MYSGLTQSQCSVLDRTSSFNQFVKQTCLLKHDEAAHQGGLHCRRTVAVSVSSCSSKFKLTVALLSNTVTVAHSYMTAYMSGNCKRLCRIARPSGSAVLSKQSLRVINHDASTALS